MKFFTLIIITYKLLSQDITSFPDFLKIMEESKKKYTINDKLDSIKPKDFSKNLVEGEFFSIEQGDNKTVNTYNPNAACIKFYDIAEELFKKENFSEARKNYLEALKADSSYYLLLTFIGDTYDHEENIEDAIIWYKKALAKNNIDILAHWFLADKYVIKDEYKLALDEILTAHILDRNNPRIFESMKNIFLLNDIRYGEWNLTPQYNFTEISEEGITINAQENWVPYAIVKSVWFMEYAYKKEFRSDLVNSKIWEEKEALLSMYVYLKSKEKAFTQPEFITLDKSLTNYFYEDFILYETILRDNPNIGKFLSNSYINGLKKYILEIRHN